MAVCFEIDANIKVLGGMVEMFNACLCALHGNLHLMFGLVCRRAVCIGGLQELQQKSYHRQLLYLDNANVQLEAGLMKLCAQKLNKENGNAIAVLLERMNHTWLTASIQHTSIRNDVPSLKKYIRRSASPSNDTHRSSGRASIPLGNFWLWSV